MTSNGPDYTLRECHELVERDGEPEPCNEPAVGWRLDEESQTYPVCEHHHRWPVVDDWIRLARAYVEQAMLIGRLQRELNEARIAAAPDEEIRERIEASSLGSPLAVAARETVSPAYARLLVRYAGVLGRVDELEGNRDAWRAIARALLADPAQLEVPIHPDAAGPPERGDRP